MARDWDRWFKEHLPRLSVPEDEVEAAFGASVGRPFRHEPDPRPNECPDCRRVVKVWNHATQRFEPTIVQGYEPGSRLYCPRCHATGFDAKLFAQLGYAGLPANPPPPEPKDGERPAPVHDPADGPTDRYDVPLPKYQRGRKDGPEAPESHSEGGGADCRGASPASV